MVPENVETLVYQIVRSGIKAPLLLIGATGIGKSQAIRSAAKRLAIPYFDLRLATQEAGDLVGMPTVENGRTIWAVPEWWPRPKTRGILFLDELNRAPLDIRNAAFQLVGDRRLHTHELPDGWYVVAAINPADGPSGYQVDDLDPAMLRRFIQIIVTTNVSAWVKWAERERLDERVVSFISKNEKILFLEETIKLQARPTPAGYEMLAHLLAADAIPTALLAEVASGIIGSAAAVTFVRHVLSNTKAPTFVQGDAVLKNYKQVSQTVAKQATDAMHRTVDSTVDRIVQHYNVPDDPAAATLQEISRNNFANLLVDLPSEFVMAAVERLRQNDAEVANHILRETQDNSPALARRFGKLFPDNTLLLPVTEAKSA